MGPVGSNRGMDRDATDDGVGSNTGYVVEECDMTQPVGEVQQQRDMTHPVEEVQLQGRTINEDTGTDKKHVASKSDYWVK